jgi:phage gp29-like protein
MADKPKRKFPSGAQKRKMKAQRDEQRGRQAMSQAMMFPGMDRLLWTAGFGAVGTDPQWDSNRPPVELPLYGRPPPKLERFIETAINGLEQGFFIEAGYLIDGMFRDDRISAKFDERLDRIVGAPLEIEPANDDSGSIKIAEEVEKSISRLMPLYELSSLMRYAIALGAGMAQVVDLKPFGQPLLTFCTWNPRYMRYDSLYRRYFIVTQNQGEVMIDWANGYDYQDGGLSINMDRTLPTRWVVYEPFGPKGWMTSAKIRSLVQPWFIRPWVRAWWARYQEVHGQPIRLGIIPADREPRDEAIFLQQLATIGHEAVIRLPQGQEDNKFDVKLLEAQTNSWEGFHKLLEHCDDSIAITLLGQQQSTRGQGGLGTQEKAGQETLTRISEKDAKVGEVIRDQLLKFWVTDTFGSPDLCPNIKWQIEPPEDESKVAKVDQLIGQALMAFKNAGAPIDVREYLNERGYPLLTPEEEAALKQERIEEAQQAMQGMEQPFGKEEEQSDEPPSDAA